MRCVFGTLFIASVLLTSAARMPAQPPQPHLTFDLVAIHPAKSGSDHGFIKPTPSGDGYLAENVSVKLMMSAIYRVPMRQITGGPDWFNTSTFNVEAKADGKQSVDELHTMFKNLLADRFGLKFHTVTNTGPVYELVVDKPGVKMKADGNLTPPFIPINMQRPSHFVGVKVPMEYLCWFLGQQMRNDPRPVIDKTGLMQVYDFELAFSPELPPGLTKDDLVPELQNLPNLFDAVREQLGLKLVPAKGPVPTYVIDHVDQPSAN